MYKKFSNRFSTLLIHFSLLAFIISFNFADNPTSGWYQQFLPNLHGAFLTDITFTDSLTGYAVTKRDSNGISYILKTSNGGDNWNVIRTDVREFSKVQFLNNDTGYAGTLFGTLDARSILFKTINGGISWDSIIRPDADFIFEDFWVLNTDSIWATYYGVFGGGIYRTINGGQSWENQYYVFGNNPHKVYMFNGKMGFMYNEKDSLFKTTNSGLNWFRVSGGAFTDIYFIDTLVGWKANGDMKKTTDGAISWVTQKLPPEGGIIIISSMIEFSNVNKDTIWGVGGEVFYGPGRFRGMIYKSTNQGETWGYQIPDTITTLSAIYNFCDFVDKSKGYAYAPPNLKGGVHTKTGGNDTTFFTGIRFNDPSILPNYFKLYQNYPNPFNPSTIISYELHVTGFVELRVFNIQGREIEKLVSMKQNIGNHEIEFNAGGLPSGVYFYSLKVSNELIDTKKMILIR